MDETGVRWCVPEALRLRAMAIYGAARASDETASRDAAETAASLLSRAMEIAAGQGARLWELRVAVSLVRLRRGADPAEELREIGAPVYCWFDEDLEAPDVRAARELIG